MLWNLMWILASKWTNKYLMQWLGEDHPPSETIGWIPPSPGTAKAWVQTKMQRNAISKFLTAVFYLNQIFFYNLFVCFIITSISVMALGYKNSMVLAPVFNHIRVTTGLEGGGFTYFFSQQFARYKALCMWQNSSFIHKLFPLALSSGCRWVVI